MNSTIPNPPKNNPKRWLNIPRPLGCCTGQALGCGCSFIASWVFALLLSALLPTLFASSTGTDPLAGILLPGFICGSSLVMAAVFSFLTGRIFPVFQRKGG